MPRTGNGMARRRRAGQDKRDQIRQCYQEHTPPQIKRMRQQNWMDRINPEPQDVPWDMPTYPCPTEGCGKVFGRARFLRNHVQRVHYPRKVKEA